MTNFYAMAEAGEIEELLHAIAESSEEPELEIYQWMQIAGSLGSELADEISEDLVEAVLSRAGDETIAALHLEVAEWLIRGEQGCPIDIEIGLEQLEYAQQFGARDGLQVDDILRDLRGALTSDAERERFDAAIGAL